MSLWMNNHTQIKFQDNYQNISVNTHIHFTGFLSLHFFFFFPPPPPFPFFPRFFAFGS